MEECLSHFLVGVFVVSRCIIESTQEFLAAKLVRTSARQFVHESAYCFVVSDGEFMRVLTGHDWASSSEIIAEKDFPVALRSSG
jgi:hypothetical protein